jgi:sugar lactone lactonase YvrE
VAGNGTTGYSGDGGTAVNASLHTPTGAAVDLVGSLYFSDTGNNVVRKVVSPTTIHQDIISTIAGNGSSGYGGDGGMATQAMLKSPSGVAVDSGGDVFIADSGNNRIREVTPNGTISTYAGTGQCSKTLGDGGKATNASLCGPTGLALDSSGNLYIADTGHSVVREVNKSTGVISTFAGNGKVGMSTDPGPCTKAEMNQPTGVAVSATGSVYIVDTGNNRVGVCSGGNLTVIVNTSGKAGFSGDGGQATKALLNGPTGLGVDPSGDLFITDTQNQRIREVTGGIISTYAGNGTKGFSGDGGFATAAALNTPSGDVAANGAAVYFADQGNQRLRGIFNGPPPVLPQLDLAIVLPLAALFVGAVGYLLMRIRRRRSSVATAG